MPRPRWAPGWSAQTGAAVPVLDRRPDSEEDRARCELAQEVYGECFRLGAE